MPSATVELSNRLKYALTRKQVDFSADVFKACLVRSGFVFNKDKHDNKAQFHGSISTTISFVGSTILGEGFSLAGFISGNKIAVSGTTSYNNASITLKSATDSILYMLESFANGTSVALLYIEDELSAGNGYLRDTLMMSGVNITEDETNDWASITWTVNCSWLATGGSIGATPGMIIIDDTASVIVGYISFASAELIAISNSLLVNGVIIRVV
jgi:hypothetical protein